MIATNEQLASALEQTLVWLEHPEVLALPFCGNPAALADAIRVLIDRPKQTRQEQHFGFPGENMKAHN